MRQEDEEGRNTMRWGEREKPGPSPVIQAILEVRKSKTKVDTTVSTQWPIKAKRRKEYEASAEGERSRKDNRLRGIKRRQATE